MADHPFVTAMQTRQARARHPLEQGAVTPGSRADRATGVRLCQEALATELICVRRSKRHACMASSMHAQRGAPACVPHGPAEQLHADQLAQRIVPLEGAPYFRRRAC